MRLEGKTAIVTGGGVGIGRGISERLAEEGARVVIAQRRLDKAREAAAAIVDSGGQALAVRSDVTDRTQVEAMIQAALEWSGGLDILVNNAGLSGMAKFSSFMDLSEELWDAVLDANLKGVFLASQAAARHMIERGSGRIIHISSVMGLIGEEFAAAYCAAKAGVIGLTKVMALELARHGITVNCIAPGFIKTETVQPIIDLMESPRSPYTYTRTTPLGPGTPRDVGDLAVFLASDEGRFFTGSTLTPDGGLLAY